MDGACSVLCVRKIEIDVRVNDDSYADSCLSVCQREDGVQRLSAHFSWPEFSDERQSFHQEFVYDVTMFATARGFPWPDVIRAAGIAKDLFPKLDGQCNMRGVLTTAITLKKSTFCHLQPQCVLLTNTTVGWCYFIGVHHTLTHNLAAVGGAANLSITRAHLEVQVPPKPCPLASMFLTMDDWTERLTHNLTLTNGHKYSGYPSVSQTIHQYHDFHCVCLALQGVLELVRVAARASGGQMQACLKEETSLVSELLQLKLQQAALATRRLHCPVPPNTPPPAPIQTHSRDGKVACSKTKRGAKKSGVQQASRPRL
uniref:Uncharacterized protein n=1 Tax=Myripristis murdjan TaxID=586833 RepID=A0A667XUF9_9TELE